MKTEAIVIRQLGGPEQMVLAEIELADPGPGEVVIELAAIGVNFIDVYFRTGLYKAPAGLPFTPGKEGAGRVVACGAGVTDLKHGDRVATASAFGSYARHMVVAADSVVKVPDGITLETAAAMMLKGMTAEYLLNRTYKVGPDTTLLFHAAAGGVGQIAGQWAKALGARVIGTAGGADKIRLALENGYDHVIDYRKDNFVDKVRELTDGKGVDVVYDSVGRDTFPQSLDCLKMRGCGFPSDNRPARWSPSIWPFWPRKARFLPPGRPFSAILHPKPSWNCVQDRFLMLCKAAKCVSISTRPTGWHKQQLRMPILRQEKRAEQHC